MGDEDEESATISLGDKLFTISNGNPDKDKKMYEFMKEGKFVDVTLTFDDGVRMPCHRCVLASASDYFECMFSNGMKESRQEEIHVGDVSSSAMAKALEFIYIGKCTFEKNDYFALLLLANMIGLKDFEASLLGHVNKLKNLVLPPFLDDEANMSTEKMRIATIDFFVEVWVFCHRHPMIGDSLLIGPHKRKPYRGSYFAENIKSAPLRSFIVSCLHSSDSLGKLLFRSKYLPTLAYDAIMDFLGDTQMIDLNPQDAFIVASRWLHENYGGMELKPSESAVMEDHFESMMAYLKLAPISEASVENLWGANSPRTRRILGLKTKQLSQEFLIIPDDGKSGRETPGFICHDIKSGKSFYLVPPTAPDQREFYGTPILSQSMGDLLCFCGERSNVIDDTPSFQRFKYSFSRNQWIQVYPGLKGPLAHDSCKSYGESDSDRDGGSESYSAPREMAEFLVPSDFNHKINVSHEDGIALSTSSRQDSHRLRTTGVILGNIVAEEGHVLKESAAYTSPIHGELPNDLCTGPLSFIWKLIGLGSVFVPSTPFKTEYNVEGNACHVRSPRVWVHKCYGLKRESKTLLSLPSPSCPDLNYAALYCDQSQRVCLVLLQNPPSESPFSQVYDRTLAKSQKQQFSGGNRNGERSQGNCEKPEGRIIGRYTLKNGDKYTDDYDITAKTEKESVSKIWEPLPVSDALADFLALGCHRPGAVRITSAFLNVNNLRPIKLVRKPIGDGPDYNVVVAKDGEQEASSSMGPWTPWLRHKDSPFFDVPSTLIDKKLNACIKKDKSLLDSVKKRKLFSTKIKINVG